MHFGTPSALCQSMMPELMETFESGPRQHCMIEQARELLEGLRAAYNSLPLRERTLFRNIVCHARQAQLLQETDQEKECFESAF